MVRTGAVTSSVFTDFRSNSDADIRDPDIRFFRALAQLGRSLSGCHEGAAFSRPWGHHQGGASTQMHGTTLGGRSLLTRSGRWSTHLRAFNTTRPSRFAARVAWIEMPMSMGNKA